MTPQRATLAALILLFASCGPVPEDEAPSGEWKRMAAAIHLEQNATDGDVEVVIKATGGRAGLATLAVVAPDGRTIVDARAPDSKLGLRHFSFESPEPQNDGTVQADFPEGEYTFTATAVSGDRLRGKATLSHSLPDTATVIRPQPDEEGVPSQGLTIAWDPVEDVRSYVVVVEQEEQGQEVSTDLPAGATTFGVPDGFLAPGTEYKLALGTVSKEGNTSFVEITFTTAGQE